MLPPFPKEGAGFLPPLTLYEPGEMKTPSFSGLPTNLSLSLSLFARLALHQYHIPEQDNNLLVHNCYGHMINGPLGKRGRWVLFVLSADFLPVKSDPDLCSTIGTLIDM